MSEITSIDPIIKVSNLNVFYQNAQVLHKVSFSINKGDYVGLVGPNGAGKTTLVKALLGLTDSVSDGIFFASDKVGYVQQKIALNDQKFPSSVFEIARSGLLSTKKFPRIFTRSDNKKTEAILDELGILGLQHKMIGKLSGGQLQKVLLARALINHPDILFLDEPTTALDPQSRETFYQLLKKINEQKGVTIILVSHDMGSIGLYASKLLVIDRRLVFLGSMKEFCESEKMTEIFGYQSQHVYCRRHDHE